MVEIYLSFVCIITEHSLRKKSREDESWEDNIDYVHINKRLAMYMSTMEKRSVIPVDYNFIKKLLEWSYLGGIYIEWLLRLLYGEFMVSASRRYGKSRNIVYLQCWCNTKL